MSLPARVVACLFTVTVLLFGSAGGLSAQNFPTRPIKLVVTFPAGGQNDVLGRLIGNHMAKTLNGTVVLENIGGAGGVVGATSVARAEPDGYTVLLGQISTILVNPLIMSAVTYDPVKDYEPVVFLCTASAILVAHPSFEANTIKELIDLAKAKPGSVQYSIPGVGSSGHLAAELLQYMAGFKLQAIPYRGAAPAATDLIAGHIKLGVDGLPGQIENIRAGLVKPLGISSATRDALAPNIPTMGETVPGYEAASWYGLWVPKGTPKDIIKKLNDAANAALKNEEVRSRLMAIGFTPRGGTPEELGAFVQSEIKKWSGVIKAADMKVQ